MGKGYSRTESRLTNPRLSWYYPPDSDRKLESGGPEMWGSGNLHN
jgi:hypothetical protein